MFNISRFPISSIQAAARCLETNSICHNMSRPTQNLPSIQSQSVRYSSTAAAQMVSVAPATSGKATTATPSPFVLSNSHQFDEINASRPPFDHKLPITVTRSPVPNWRYGEGASHVQPNQNNEHIEIDPATRSFIDNYKLLVSAIPRPISFVSTVSKDGKQKNLAPFSYFQVIDHDPPIFVIGFSSRPGRMKDTRRNLLETGECVISVVSEHMVEGVNATSLDVPYGTSEWALSGFKGEKASTVRPERVREAVFSVEGKLLEMKDLAYHGEAERGKPTGALAIIEGTRFWVSKDASNVEGNSVDLNVMRPLVALGGISYGRVREVFEWPRGYLPTELQKTENGLAQILQKEESGNEA